MSIFILAFFFSFLLQAFIIRLTKKIFHSHHYQHDLLHQGPQRIHQNPTPRTGGLGLYISFLITLLTIFLFLIVLFLIYIFGF
jgi:UDP-N-acetylmuramyl pentapeptide phosphotransferase/UDP-N-acetylglucosamine-1-phosphate transferase